MGRQPRVFVKRKSGMDYSFARMWAPENFRTRLARQITTIFEAITTAPPARTVGNGNSFQINQPNSDGGRHAEYDMIVVIVC